MSWTYPDLKAAYTALSPAPADDAAAAATLNAQTVTLTQPAADVGLGDIQGVLLLSGDWLKIVGRSKGAASSAALTDPVNVAQLAVALVEGKAATVGAANWNSFLGMLQVLVGSADVQQNTYNQVAALAPLTVAKWQPAVTALDVQAAKAWD